ncbi:LicD family protein [Lysinibacillus xylanilyticus]|uniref:nucleoside-diphosphate sugar epimerase/dehydratase n=1 Tax=Lysinibacillus xylanilyticus TaxID=582475 RepID=UPI002B253CB8|nr:LicD family protein [Lysinibacillus xylanilyticus]MEB2298497.1 LicD family protein [Lysinibacillus xylanilyticus]
MKKILLFGASSGGQNFFKNHSADYEFLAILDNDINKHGKILNNVEVVSPEHISSYHYDKIIVASMYVESISKQLSELGIPKGKIEFASKNSMKVDELPFENPNTLKKTNQLIVVISKVLHEIPHYYTFGTLLGIARDGGLIPWDDDIDIAIFASDTDDVQSTLIQSVKKFEELFDIKLFLRTYSNGKPASITMDCLDNGRKLFMINFDCMYGEGDMIKQELNDTPAKFFEGFDELPFEGINIQVPKDYQGYLDYTYGDWHVVKKNTSFADNTISFREPIFSCTIEHLYESK